MMRILTVGQSKIMAPCVLLQEWIHLLKADHVHREPMNLLHHLRVDQLRRESLILHHLLNLHFQIGALLHLRVDQLRRERLILHHQQTQKVIEVFFGI